MKRILLGLFGVLLLLLLIAFLFRTTIALRMMERVVATNLGSDWVSGLHVLLCGAGSPLPDPKRSGPCTAVIAGEHLYIVDAGAGSSRVLSRMRLPQGEIDLLLQWRGMLWAFEVKLTSAPQPEDLRRLRAAVRVAQEVGEGLGRGALLLGAVPPRGAVRLRPSRPAPGWC